MRLMRNVKVQMSNDKENREKVQVEVKVEARGKRLEAGGWRQNFKYQMIN